MDRVCGGRRDPWHGAQPVVPLHEFGGGGFEGAGGDSREGGKGGSKSSSISQSVPLDPQVAAFLTVVAISEFHVMSKVEHGQCVPDTGSGHTVAPPFRKFKS